MSLYPMSHPNPGSAAQRPLLSRAPALADAVRAPLHLVYAHRHGRATRELMAQVAAHPALNGRPLRWHVPPEGALLPLQARAAALAARSDGGVVVAMGGDGTINAVVQAARLHGQPVAVLPMGTFNYFARQQGLPDELDAAIAALARALREQALRPVQLGDVNGQAFLVNASLGLYPRLLAEREQATRRFGRTRAVAVAAGVATLLRPLPQRRMGLTARLPDGSVARSVSDVSTLFVGNNALQLANVGVPEADQVRHGALGAVLLPPASRWQMARLVWRMALGRIADEPWVQHLACEGLEVRDPSGRQTSVMVAFDGERRRMALPIRFGVADRPLWLVAGPQPQPTAEAEAASPEAAVPRPPELPAPAALAPGLARAPRPAMPALARAWRAS